MGSTVLGEAISSIRDWSVTEAKEPRGPRATEAFGSLVFHDEVQQTRLPKPVYHALRRTMTHGEPLDVSVAASRQDLNGGANRFSTWVLGGSYNFGLATLQGAYNHDRNDTGAGTTFRHWLVGTVIPVGAAEIHASYNKMDAGSGNGAKMAAVGAVYNLSKRTAVYGTYSQLSNEGAFKQSVDFSYPAAVSGNTPVTAGGRSRGLELGIRHFF